ncbi:MAG: hypothetical protein JSS35_03275 [Proteobacteria bacterium]|nr:hypothetical protein [Pseudomonadota bacterium]
MRIAVLSLLMFAGAAAAARATPPAGPPAATPPAAPTTRPRDPIAGLLNPNAPESRDEDEPDTVGKAKGASDDDLDIGPARAGRPGPTIPFTAVPRSQRDLPVTLDQTGQTPDSPPDQRAQTYDARIRSSFASAQGFQGPLDGGWTLSSPGCEIAFQIVDRRDRLEAVWRDVRRAGSLDASGLVDDIQRRGGTLTLRFSEAPFQTALVTLREGADGDWSGRMVRGAQAFDVTLRRTSP